MPPCHRDSPLGHCAFRVALGHRSKNASRLFVEKRVKQRYATSEIRLDVRRARYRERDFPDAAQIARFGSGCAFDVVCRTRKATGQSDKNKLGEANAIEPCSRLADRITIPANCKITSATGKPSNYVILSEAKLQRSPEAFGTRLGFQSQFFLEN